MIYGMKSDPPENLIASKVAITSTMSQRQDYVEIQPIEFFLAACRFGRSPFDQIVS
jgi:hypothetical protein